MEFIHVSTRVGAHQFQTHDIRGFPRAFLQMFAARKSILLVVVVLIAHFRHFSHVCVHWFEYFLFIIYDSLSRFLGQEYLKTSILFLTKRIRSKCLFIQTFDFSFLGINVCLFMGWWTPLIIFNCS